MMKYNATGALLRFKLLTSWNMLALPQHTISAIEVIGKLTIVRTIYFFCQFTFFYFNVLSLILT